MKVTIDGTEYVPKSNNRITETLADIMSPYIGTKEYDGIIATIQKWYYGTVLKTPWCATAISYFASQMGILNQFGGKHENVYHMMNGCIKNGNGQFFIKEDIPSLIQRGDVLFFAWAGKMEITSSKHVTVCYSDTMGADIDCIGGNQSNMIYVTNYDRKYLYALYRPKY